MIAADLAVRSPAPGRWELMMPGLPEYVRAARELARAASATAYQAEAAALCVSELVTNAIVHSLSGRPGGVITVTATQTLISGPGLLRISVGSEASLTPPGPWLRPPVTDGLAVPEHGYGLAVVDAVASDWGRFRDVGGWVTWCDIPAGSDI
jgi:anti-sigma regulatory factor (Ser/Thr protein kinase)